MTDEADATDEALMQAISSGAREPLDELYRRYQGELRRYFRRFDTGPAEADDLVHDTFMRLMRYGASFDAERPFRGWLFGIARNVALGTVRKARHVAIDDVSLAAPGQDSVGRKVDDALEALEVGLGRLSDDDRALLIMAKLERRPYRDIARTLGATEGAVKVRVFRALNRLRAELRTGGDEGGWLDEQ